MSLFNDLSRELLRTSSTSHKLFKSSSGVAAQEGADAELFYELAVKSTVSQMAYLEHNRVEHMLLKSTFDSFQ
ncbi:hypothetical protein JFV30_02865 [Pseudomonas sp. TH32]|jgi:hypothetical protein|uniref:hypothetical protein n=1 Tax=unclassified Pseudomonas TaxID=196821 RepID=UPI00191160FC|nr:MULTISPECIES: hypothetical protein [unclassified Pseudomonas]MBK5435834.1 hypothetical protein [Pseudomonas sp. TH32]MDF3201363.1 hypothetical protein [Pseudomonas sp. 1912-s]